MVLDGGVVLLAAFTLVASSRRARVWRLLPLALAVATLAGASITFLAQGRRWQLVPALVAATVAGVASMRNSREGRARRIVRVIAYVDGAMFVAASAVLAWALPVAHFPAPAGPFDVGTLTLELGSATRPLVTQFWYPVPRAAGYDEPRSRYVGRTDAEAREVVRGMSGAFGVPAFLLDGIVDARTQARVTAGMADGKRWPVVLFSPGSSSVRMQNTAWASELASNGYVVAALDHPHDSAVVVLEDGRVIESAIHATGDDDHDQRVADEATLARAHDLRAVLDELRAIDRGTPDTVLKGSLDVRRVAVAGHSLGGAAALQAAAIDRRFDVAINIDGLPRNEALPRQPVLLIVASRGSGNPENDERYERRLARVLREADDSSERITVDGAAHLTFTDAPLFLPPLPSLIGSLGRKGAITRTADITLAFLDAHLASER